MMTRLKRVPIAAWAFALVMVPLAVKLVMEWQRLPLAYGQTIGPADPDVWLRLSLVRDWISGTGWYDHMVARSNAPMGGIATPWTRPLDVVIAFFTSIQPTGDLSTRLIRAALVLPFVWMGLLLLGLYRNVHLLSAAPMGPFMVSALVTSCFAMRNYFTSGNADHHALLAVLFVWALGSVLRPSPRTAQTVVGGLLLGAQLWVSPEAILLIAAVYGWYGLLWLAGEKERAAPWALLSVTVAATVAGALMIERPQAEWMAVHYDTLSIVYVVLTGLGAAVICLLQALSPTRFTRRLAAMAVLGGVGFCVAWRAFPLVLHGPYAGADPYIFAQFLPRITEAQSLPGMHPLYISAMLLQPVLAIGILGLAGRYGSNIFSPQRRAQLAYFILATGALYLAQQRFYYYFYPMLVLVLAPFLAVLFTPSRFKELWLARWLNGLPETRQALCRAPLTLAVLGVPSLLIVLEPKQETLRSRQIDSCQTIARQLIYGGKLNALPPLTFFVSTDLGGEMLFFTPHRIIASNYHREAAGIRYVWEADTITEPAALRQYLAARKVEALLLCPTVKESDDSVLRRLRRGGLRLPWLVEMPYARAPLQPKETRDEADSPPVLFRVR